MLTRSQAVGAAQRLDERRHGGVHLGVDVEPGVGEGVEERLHGGDRLPLVAHLGVADLRPRPVLEPAREIGDPVEALVVEGQEHAVGGDPAVGLQVAVAHGHRPAEGAQRVLPADLGRAAPVGERDRLGPIQERELPGHPRPGARRQLFADLALQAEQDRRHAPQTQAGDHLGEPELLVEVVGGGEHLVGTGALEALPEDPGEAPGRRRLGGDVEEQVDLPLVVDLGGQEERRLALDHLLHLVAVAGQVLGQRRDLAGVLQQRLEAQVLRGTGEEVDDAPQLRGSLGLADAPVS